MRFRVFLLVDSVRRIGVSFVEHKLNCENLKMSSSENKTIVIYTLSNLLNLNENGVYLQYIFSSFVVLR